KNITFKERGGKEGQPITVTTTGPGVIIDLKDATLGWGGFRLGNDTMWIVIDGGGNPNPFDESTYHLVIQNAAYAARGGAERSDCNCRPVTIQSSQHIILRNICGKRSMGTFGVFGTVKDVLIENCRCTPGEKIKDPGASHGIYVGSGADDVIIRHCFVKWSGESRLGLQNNGGGKNVLIEDCFVTECGAAIKSFNGGGVNAKSCYFWDNVDAEPMQGEVTSSGILRTPPATSLMVPMTPVKPGSGTGTKFDAKRPKPPSDERLREISQTRTRAAGQITKLLTHVKRLDVTLPCQGQVQQVILSSANVDVGLEGKVNGGKMVIGWEELTASNLAGVLELLAGDTPAEPGPLYATMAVLYAIDGADVLAATMSTKAMDADPDQGDVLKAALTNLK
ncbi:MAG TPA: right-handed parallel beta-helix repeat-containing protein, partial [Planctomycetota bacterium]|nr:right-handed parallel beta-helix repeat-containing protein [Planctomycetota bacterium]